MFKCLVCVQSVQCSKCSMCKVFSVQCSQFLVSKWLVFNVFKVFGVPDLHFTVQCSVVKVFILVLKVYNVGLATPM